MAPDEVASLVGGEEPPRKKQDLFKQLVDEGFIDANLSVGWKGDFLSLMLMLWASREKGIDLYPRCRETKMISSKRSMRS